jgi:hypothetical protein
MYGCLLEQAGDTRTAYRIHPLARERTDRNRVQRRRGSLEGDVVDADGRPATGGVVALRNGRAVVARATGHFKLQNVTPWDYAVYAWDDPAEVAYTDTEYMRRYAGTGVAVTVSRVRAHK